ncbi:MAG: PepSY-associated TM helix domain-containing protein [Opitutaceae bacterium]
MRKRLWQLHSWFGLVAGLGLLVIGLTGSLLVFHEELEAWLNPALVRVEPSPAGRLPLDTLLAHAQRQLPSHEITGWLPRHDAPELADVLYVIEHGHTEWLVATLDPYTGRVLASPRLGTATLTGWLLELHYELLAGHAGMLVAGLFAVMLCLLGVSGLWLYREFWRNLFTLRWGRGARILFSDLHKFVGITSVAFNLMLGFTGAYWNTTHLFAEWIVGEPEQQTFATRLYAPTLSLDALASDAAARLPGFRGNFISLPSAPAAPAVTLWGAVEPRNWLTSPYGSTLVYDPQTGGHRATADLRVAGLWARVIDSFRPLHFGDFGGLPIKILWGLGGLAPGVLAVSGSVIWWLRHRRSRTP